MTVLEQAARLLRDKALCDDCLGRQFAKLGHGLGNAERGTALRATLCLVENSTLTHPTLCPLCLNQFEKISAWAERAVALAEEYEFSTYLMGTRVPQFIQDNESDLQQQHDLKHAEKFNQSFNRAVGKAFDQAWQKKHNQEVGVDFHHPDVVVNLDLTWDKATLQVNPLYVYGRYRKLIRGIPQTHWPCKACKGRGCSACGGTGEQYPESVESLISQPLNSLTRGSSVVLHGAGREDIDALMLGSGRPFVIEVKQPKKRALDWDKTISHVNSASQGKVEVANLQAVTGQVVGRIKAQKAEKRYRVLAQFASAIQNQELQRAIEGLIGPIQQRTPQRVAHRRADLVRRREVFEMEGTVIDAMTAEILLRCSGGLYVKELISGDEGRTDPSLTQRLEVDAKVLELDVVDILGDFL